jgi:hypothetical protein
MMIAIPAFAQTATYESPGYSPSAPAALDSNYGLPTFGMAGAGLPQQRTMATETAAAAASAPPDAGRPPVDFTPAAIPADATYSTETPVYTTSETEETGKDTLTDDAAR